MTADAPPMDGREPHDPRIPILSPLSDGVAHVEKILIAALAFGICALILLNVFTRYANNALYWVDESAISAMVWMAMVGASLTVRTRAGVAVTLIIDMVPTAPRWILSIIIDAITLGFGIALIAMSWLWFDLPGLAAAGWDVSAYQGATFRFQYSEPTVTIGISKVWLWLIMPLTAVTITLHATANLAENWFRRSEYGKAALHESRE